MSVLRRHFFTTLLSVLALASCAEWPAREATPPDPQRIRLSAEAHAALLQARPALDHAALQAYVNGVGQRLARQTPWPGLDWRFTVLDEAAVNAYSLPGGQIYLTRGVLAFANSEAELAAVIAHELGHVVAGDGAPALAVGRPPAAVVEALARDWAAGHGRERELEASRRGAEYLARAGYNPLAMFQVLSALKLHERFTNERAHGHGAGLAVHHATLSQRAGHDARLRQVVEAAQPLTTALPREGRNDYLAQITGVPFGERPSGRGLRGALFVHGELGLALAFPPAWPVQHDAGRAMATHPQGDAWIELRRGEGTPHAALQAAFALDAGARYSEGALNGLPAVFVAGTQNGRPLIAAALTVDGARGLVAGVGRDAAAYARERKALRDAINSVRAMTPEERQAMRPPVLRVVQARAGTGFAELAKASPLGADAEAWLRLINGLYPGGEPTPGQLVKIVQ